MKNFRSLIFAAVVFCAGALIIGCGGQGGGGSAQDTFSGTGSGSGTGTVSTGTSAGTTASSGSTTTGGSTGASPAFVLPKNALLFDAHSSSGYDLVWSDSAGLHTHILGHSVDGYESGAITRDRRTVYYCARDIENSRRIIGSVEADGTNPRVIFEPDFSWGALRIHLSADEKSLIFVDNRSGPGCLQLWKLDIASGTLSQIASPPDFLDPNVLGWDPKDRFLIVRTPSPVDGTYFISTNGGSTPLGTAPPGTKHSFSASGNKIVSLLLAGSMNVYDCNTNTSVAIHPNYSGGGPNIPIFDTTEKYIYFIAGDTDPDNGTIRRVSVEGGNAVMIQPLHNKVNGFLAVAGSPS